VTSAILRSPCSAEDLLHLLARGGDLGGKLGLEAGGDLGRGHGGLHVVVAT
jgi:hypothetical protein